MSDERIFAPRGWWRKKFAPTTVVLMGIVLGQAVLYGPSLVGLKILLPLDILAVPGVYLPKTPETERAEIKNVELSDLLCLSEPARRFAASEIKTGRLPSWAPYQFAGAPVISPRFSPFFALECCTECPVILAWAQMLMAIVAGLGAYAFCRRMLAVGFWPATIAAWCYPLTGFFILWQGFATGLAVYWLPWILLTADKTARCTSPRAPVWLALATCLVLISGHLDVGSQVVLASGLYGLWCLLDAWRNEWFGRQARRAATGLAAGWALGFLLAAPYILPALDYSRTGARMAHRSAGQEERPPVGLAALPQIVLPHMYGAMTGNTFRLVEDSQSESSAAAYAGVLATLLVAPLAWCSRRHRAINIFLTCFAFFGLSWCLNVPGFVHLLRLPGLNMMSHNRLVFMTAFAILAMAAIGLDVLLQGPLRWRPWVWLPAAVLAGLCAWCVYRAAVLPDPIETGIKQAIAQGRQVRWVRDMDGLERVQAWFTQYYATAAIWCGIGIVGWCLLWSRRRWQSKLLPAIGVLLLGDLLWFAHGRNVQCDPALYFPPIPVLEQVARSPSGRVIGYNCLPASLAAMCGLRDVRGYDGVDPARMVALLDVGADPTSPRTDYALTQQMAPRATLTPEGDLRLSPVLDMLGVRYVIYRGSPPSGTRPAFQGNDYWVRANPAALSRAFVPRRVEVVTDDATRLEKLASPEFNPRETAYVESLVTLPDLCVGTAEVMSETPVRISLSVSMETPGLVVLADSWDKGWRSYVNGRSAPILRTNHALRGVVVPAGPGTLEFRYKPVSFVWGLALSGAAAIVVIVWLGVVAWARREAMTPSSKQPNARALLV